MKTVMVRGGFALLLLLLLAVWLAVDVADPAVNRRAGMAQEAVQEAAEAPELIGLAAVGETAVAAVDQRVVQPPETGIGMLKLPLVFYVVIVALVFALFLRFQENWDIK